MIATLSDDLQGWGTVAAVALALWLAVSDHRKARKHREDEERSTRLRDLDETRRVLYMAVVRDAPGFSAEARATIVNALAHHSALMTAGDAVSLVGGKEDSLRAAMAARAIGRICIEAGDPPPTWGRVVPIGRRVVFDHEVYGPEHEWIYEEEVRDLAAFYLGDDTAIASD